MVVRKIPLLPFRSEKIHPAFSFGFQVGIDQRFHWILFLQKEGCLLCRLCEEVLVSTAYSSQAEELSVG